MTVTLKNDLLTVVIDSKGAELRSIKNNRTGYEYLWQGDDRFWGRRSPVLFPIVGAVWNGEYRIDEKLFKIGQHGFARDCEFAICDGCGDDEAWFELSANETTRMLYPRDFVLKIGYILTGERILVKWRVENLDDKDMSFQIGAHPGFNYPDFKADDTIHGYFHFDRAKMESQIISEKGCVGSEMVEITLDQECMMPLTANTFDRDAFILADRQIGRVSMMDREQRPYLTLLFNAPLVGLWSPPGKNAPFVCIEPWWGRCDRVGYDGDFSQREYMNVLAPGKIFDAGYMIIIDNL